jgi:hypothetical protein
MLRYYGTLSQMVTLWYAKVLWYTITNGYAGEELSWYAGSCPLTLMYLLQPHIDIFLYMGSAWNVRTFCVFQGRLPALSCEIWWYIGLVGMEDLLQAIGVRGSLIIDYCVVQTVLPCEGM